MKPSQLSLVLALWLACLMPAVQAATVEFTPSQNDGLGTVSGDVPCDKIGSVAIPRGRAAVDGNQIEISTIPEYMFDRQVVLSGIVINTEAHVTGQNAQIAGVAYLYQGDWIKYLEKSGAVETVATADAELTGHITAVSDTQVDIDLADGTHSQVPIASIKNIFSPKSFRFSIPAKLSQAPGEGKPFQAQAEKIVLNQSGRPYKLTALRQVIHKQEDRDLSWKQITAISAGYALVELGQLAPFIILPAVSQSLQDRANAKNLQAVMNPYGVIVGAHSIPPNE